MCFQYVFEVDTFLNQIYYGFSVFRFRNYAWIIYGHTNIILYLIIYAIKLSSIVAVLNNTTTINILLNILHYY